MIFSTSRSLAESVLFLFCLNGVTFNSTPKFEKSASALLFTS